MARPLSDLRKAVGLTQNELAIEIGVKRTAVANYEAGTRQPDIDRAKRIARVLGVTVEEIDFSAATLVTNRREEAMTTTTPTTA